MDRVDYLAAYDVVTCRACFVGIRPEHIGGHFKAPPHQLGKAERERICKHAQRLREPSEGGRAEASSHPRTPPPDSTAFQALGPAFSGGLACTLLADGGDSPEDECGYVLGNVKNMELHCRRVHGWTSKTRRGRPRRHATQRGVAARPWRSGIEFQRFYTHGPGSSFFEVNRGRQTPSSGNAGLEAADPYSRLLGAIRERRLAQREAEQDTMLNIDETVEPNPWQRRVGIALYLRQIEHLSLSQMRQLAYEPLAEASPEGAPPGAEVYIAEIHRAFRRLIWRARANAILEKVGIFALFEVERRVSGEESNRPFNANIRRDTIRRYRYFWNGIWTYIFRVWQLPPQQRPPFTLTNGQKRLLAEVARVAEGIALSKRGGSAGAGLSPKAQREKLEDAVLDLVIELLDQDLKDNQYRSILVSALAVLSVEEDGSYGDLEDFLPRVSGVIKFARLAVIQKAHRARAKELEIEMRQNGRTEEEAEEAVEGHVARVTYMVERFMIRHPKSDRGPKPMDWLIKLRTFGLRIQYTTPIDGQVYWVGDVLHYQSIRFSMDALRGFVRGIVAEMRQLLFEHLLFVRDGHSDAPEGLDLEELAASRLPRIDWNWVDNPTEKTVGWSFLKDIRNKFDVDGEIWLARRIVESRALSRKFTRPEHGGVCWTKRAVDQYRRYAERFLEKMLVSAQFTWGQPSRVPEIMSLRHRNTANGGVRNVFLDQGLVVLVTMYSKNYERSGKLNPIQRFLPREVGGPLLLYIWLVIPFLEGTESNGAGGPGQPTKPASAFIWGDRSLIAADAAGSSASSSEEEDDQSNEDDEGDEVDEIASGLFVQTHKRPRRGKARRRRRQSSRWKPELMRRLVKRDTERLMKVKIGVSTWRQVAPAISRKYLRHKFQPEPQFGRSEDAGHEDAYEQEYEAGAVRDSPWDGQGGHGSFTAGMIYGRLIFEAEYESMDIRAQFRAVSEEWHRFLGFPSSIGDTGPLTAPRKHGAPAYWEKACAETGLERWKQLQEVDIRARLKHLVGPDAEFRSVQEQALTAIMSRANSLLVIMGTGAGKSICFMLPASCSLGGVTIVIVPLVSLQGDMQRRCESCGISAIVWNSRRPHDTAPLIFVTPESALSKSFAGLLTRLTATYQLERIVVDECHAVLDGTKDFRPKLRELGKLVLRGVQMVYLTATLPPRDEAEFFELMHIDSRSLTQLRGVTTRRNVKYQVMDKEVPPPTYDVLGRLVEDKLDVLLQQVIEQKLAQYPAPAKIIVYCGEVDTAERLGERFGCAVFHSNVDTRDGKLRRLADWMNGLGPGTGDLARRVIAASTALGLGIDVPDVRAVVHYGRLRKLKDYAQESGRAGRDGLPSEAIIVRRPAKAHPALGRADAPGAAPGRMFPDMDEYVGGSFCRRKILDMVMDGRTDRTSCELGEEQCDVCVRQANDTESEAVMQQPLTVVAQGRDAQLAMHHLRSRIGRRQGGRIECIERLRDYVEVWAGNCMLCFWSGRECGSHDTVDCPAEEVDHALQGIWILPREIRKWRGSGEFSGCHECLLPQALCDKWQSRGDAGGWELRDADGATCQFPDLIATAFVCLWVTYHDEITPAIYERMAQDAVNHENIKQRYSWFGTKVRWGDVESNQLCEVLIHMSDRVLQKQLSSMTSK